ncbi:MAG: S9 family peptidase [Longimicrobiales bacterium]
MIPAITRSGTTPALLTRRANLTVRVAVSGLAVACGLALPRIASAQTFSIEDVLSYAFPTDLVTARDGGRIAWLENAEGRRNVLVAEAPAWTPRRITPFTEDDGVELSALQFLADGQRLVFMRGHTSNMDGETANPTSDIEGADRELWMVDVRGGTASRIAGAVNAVVSPTESQLVWADDGDAWLLDLTTATPSEPQRLFDGRAGLSSLEWSPDGERIAFASERDGRAILGVFTLASRKLEWITNSVDQDDLPRWSPDGSRIAFIREVAGFPGYGVWSVDLTSGETKELWHSPRDTTVESDYPGSIAGNYDIAYGDGFIVVPGEWSGYNHLYAIPVSGGEARELTPGAGIVENAALSADGQWVWVSTNTQSIDHRQLGRIRLRDGHSEWIETGKANAWNPSPSPDGRSIAYIRSDHAEPASVYRRVLADDEANRLGELPARFPVAQMVEPEQVIYRTQDGWDIHGQLFLPPALPSGERRPAVIFMHGGSRRQMFLGWHNRGYYHGAYAFNQYLASRGYVVLSINYRSGIGYGVKFRNPPNYGRSGASEYQDVLDAGLWLRTRPEVDPQRIGLWGGSYGGFLTAMGLARNSDVFKAGVDLHGVHDWWQQSSWYGRRDIEANTDSARARRDVAMRSSPVASIDTWTSPVLIVHGDDDRNVPFEASIDLVRRLRQKGDVHFEELYFVDEVHGFLRHESWLTTFHAAADFFDEQLRNRVATDGSGARSQLRR